MSREVRPPSTDEYGSEVHPAFGAIGASRISSSPGAVLFDSDVRHQHSVVVTISRSSRQRQNGHDYLHPREELIEVELSEAQWASFVSSMNVGSGVPCTLRRVAGEAQPGLPYAPRLAESMAEVHGAAESAFAAIKVARDTYEAVLNDKGSTAKQKREALQTFHYAIENATPNVDFAAKSLSKHTENVVQRARADIEAMVTDKAAQLGIEAADLGVTLAIEPSNTKTCPVCKREVEVHAEGWIYDHEVDGKLCKGSGR